MGLFWTVTAVAVYLLITAGFGYLGFRRTRTEADYLLAGRQVHPFVMALSYGATFISTSAIVGFGGAAAVYGMGLLWLTFLNIALGIFVAFVFFGHRTRRIGHNMGAHSFPEFLGLRFQSRPLQAASGTLIFIAMPLYAAAVLMGGAQFLGQTFKLGFDLSLLLFAVVVAVYVVMGGLKGVMYTDAFQAVVMLCGMTFLLVFAYTHLGGVREAHTALTSLAPEAVKVFGAQGHLGWTSMPRTGSVMWLQMVTMIILGVGIGVLAQPQLAVRFMTVRSDRELNRAVPVGALFILMMPGVAYTVGALTNVYFFRNPDFGTISFLAAGKNVDAIIPLFINRFLPPWFSALFLVTLMAAGMSTLSSQFHTMGTAFARDMLPPRTGGIGGMARARIGMIIAILVSVLVALSLPRFFEKGSAIIALGTSIFFSLCTASLLPAFVSALYVRRATPQGVLAGFFSGAAVSVFWLLFVNAKVAVPLGLCRLTFGMDTLAGATSWKFVDSLVVGLPVSILVTVVVSLLTARMPEEHLKKCFR